MRQHHSSNGETYGKRVFCRAKAQVMSAVIAGGAALVAGGFARATSTVSGRAIVANVRIGTHTNGIICRRGSSE